MNIRAIFLALMSSALAAGGVEATKPQNPPHRPLSALQVDVHASLRSEASTRRLGDNTPQVLKLIDLYHELAAHPQRDNSPTLKQLGQKLRSRLESVRDPIDRKNAGPRRLAKSQDIRPAVTLPKYRVLAQQIALPGGAAMGQGAGQTAPPAAGLPTDYGPDLVDLIQRTISPTTWDINGGNGAIVYYAPLRVLVVSAPGTVHEQVGGMLPQLRAKP